MYKKEVTERVVLARRARRIENLGFFTARRKKKKKERNRRKTPPVLITNFFGRGKRKPLLRLRGGKKTEVVWPEGY